MDVRVEARYAAVGPMWWMASAEGRLRQSCRPATATIGRSYGEIMVILVRRWSIWGSTLCVFLLLGAPRPASAGDPYVRAAMSARPSPPTPSACAAPGPSLRPFFPCAFGVFAGLHVTHVAGQARGARGVAARRGAGWRGGLEALGSGSGRGPGAMPLVAPRLTAQDRARRRPLRGALAPPRVLGAPPRGLRPVSARGRGPGAGRRPST